MWWCCLFVLFVDCCYWMCVFFWLVSNFFDVWEDLVGVEVGGWEIVRDDVCGLGSVSFRREGEGGCIW